MTSGALEKALNDRILMLDGGFGTMLQKAGLTARDFIPDSLHADPSAFKPGNNEILNLTRPDIIKRIHLDYLEAGADIITTNTFSANSVSQSDRGAERLVHEMNSHAVRIAAQAREEYINKNGYREIFIAGSFGPTSKSYALSADMLNPAKRGVTFDTLYSAYLEQAEALIPGIDIALVETAFDSVNVRAAVAAIIAASDRAGIPLPIMVSVTVTGESGRLLTGQDCAALFHGLPDRVVCASVNCSFGAEQLMGVVKRLSEELPFYIGAYPNAGLPDSSGNYNEPPEKMAAVMAEMAHGGYLNIAGGCCGTTPAHIACIKAEMEKHRPRPLTNQSKAVRQREAMLCSTEVTRIPSSGASLLRMPPCDGDLYDYCDSLAEQAEGFDGLYMPSSLASEKLISYISADPSLGKLPIVIELDGGNAELAYSTAAVTIGRAILHITSGSVDTKKFEALGALCIVSGSVNKYGLKIEDSKDRITLMKA